MPPERRFDTWNTSTGKAMEYRPGDYFPDTDFRATVADPLPPALQVDKPAMISPYETSTGAAHDTKYGGGILGNERLQRAAGNWNVHYVKDHVEKLENRRWRPALTMGNEESEMKAKYKGESKIPGVDFEHKINVNPQGFLLENHHIDGPSKVGIGSSENPALQGEPFYIKDSGVLRELDPYISTTQKDHRRFDDGELKGYPKKDVATFWSCEEYPTTLGHGPLANQLPKGAVPRERPPPMRDTLVFKEATRVPFWPRSAKPVPNGGYKTEHRDKYTLPLDERMRDALYCPVDSPYTLTEPSAADLNLPAHYNTMYEYYGSEEKVQVTS